MPELITNYLLICGDMNAHTQEREDWVVDKYLTDTDMDEHIRETLYTVKKLELAQIPLWIKSMDTSTD